MKSLYQTRIWFGIASVSAVFAIALVSFVFPNAVFDTTTDMTNAVSISSTSSVHAVVDSLALGRSQLDLEYIDDTYYLLFTSSTVGLHVYLTTSTDGTSWSTPQQIVGWASSDGKPAAIDLVYNSRNDSLNLLYLNQGVEIATSLNYGATWTTSSLLTVLPDCTISHHYFVGLAFSANSDMAAVACGDSNVTSTPSRVNIAISDDGGATWGSTSTVITSLTHERMVQSFVSISGDAGEEVIHVLSAAYDSDGDSSTPTSTVIIYASSTDDGATFTSRTLAEFDPVFIPSLGYWTQEAHASFAADENGYPGFFMRDFESISIGATVAVTSSFLYGKYDGTSWSTSTLGLQETLSDLSFPNGAFAMLYTLNRIDLAYFNTNDPILLYQPDNDTGIIGINTSSFQYTNFFDGGGLGIGSRSVAYNSTDNEIGIVSLSYAENGAITFYRTNSGVLPAGSAPTAPSGLTTSTVSTSSITFAWTDNSADETSFLFDYVASTSVAAFPGTTSSVAANGTSQSLTGLTPNTSYYARVAAVNGSGTSSYSTSTIVVTQAIAPTTLTGTSLGRTSVSLDWNDVGGTQYKVYQDGSLIVSTALTESTVTGLTCNTAYTFTVKAVNSLDQLSSDTATVSVTTDACAASSSGGGGSGFVPAPPTLPTAVTAETGALVINNGDASTTERTVRLHITAANTYQMAVSETSDFSTAAFVPFVADSQHVVSPGNGLKTVYVLLRSEDGATITIVDSIELTDQQTNDSSCPLTTESAYKSTVSNAVYYITTDCTKRPFKRSDVFFTYFDSWSDVTQTTESILEGIPVDLLGFMPWGPLYNPASGALIKLPNDAKVYFLLDGVIYHIENETAAMYQFGPDWNTWIDTVDPRLKQTYDISTDVLGTSKRLDGMLITYAGNDRVYRLETIQGVQVKRWIINEETFAALSYRFDRVVTVPSSEVYPDGSELSLVATPAVSDDETLVFTSFLSLGDSGAEVTALQERVKALGFFPIDVVSNGVFGPTTEEAVKALQRANNIAPAGYVGPSTREILNG